ncbi:MAG: peptidoglycan DD-metalloendopeptidase family protein [Succinatimonas sp.]|nr:peptidoglycan DD-metalloendopeptidase family protein [Succinatimonas sp.]
MKSCYLPIVVLSALLFNGCISNNTDNYANNIVVEDARSGSTHSRVSQRRASASSKVTTRTVNVAPKKFQEQPLGSNTAPAGGTDYRVVQGDTLFSIAFRYGQNYQSLASENGIEAPYNIHVGQIIHINGNGQSGTVLQDTNSYIVQKGDTLTSVAKAHNLPPSALVRVNNLSYPYKLVPGQHLTLEDPDAGRKVEKTEQKVVPVAGNDNTGALASENEQVTPSSSVNIVSGKTRTAGGVVWMWPAKGKVVRGFSLNENGNKGIDIAGNRGQNVMSAADGQVVYSGSALRGYGKLIIVNHDNEYLSAYAHNDSLLVKEGQKVKRGQVIAKMGSTDSSSVQLHFEIRYKGKSVNPLGYLPK